MLKSLAPKMSFGAVANSVGQLLENSYHNVANKDRVNEQMPINQPAQASIISQLTLEESPQVDWLI